MGSFVPPPVIPVPRPPSIVAEQSRYPADQYENPYYLHSADHAGLVLVSDRLTTASDFHSWRRSILMALNVRNKLGFINGTISKPPEDHRDFGAWSRCNDIVSTWLMNSVDKKIGQSLLFIATAQGIWNNLLSRFKQDDAPRIFDIEQKLSKIEQDSMDVSTYYTALLTLWEEHRNYVELPVCTCGRCECDAVVKWESLQQRSRVTKFLMGLNEGFDKTRRHILMLKPIPTIEEAFNIVTQDEHQKNVKPPTPYNTVKPAQKPVCTHCGKVGHTIQKCYKLHGYPPGMKIGNGNYQYKTNPQLLVQPRMPMMQAPRMQYPAQMPMMPYANSMQKANAVAHVYVESGAYPSEAYNQASMAQVQVPEPVASSSNPSPLAMATVSEHGLMAETSTSAPLHFVETMPLTDEDSLVPTTTNNNNTSNASSSTSALPSTILPTSTAGTHDLGLNTVPIARSKRNTRAPAYLSKYHCALVPFISSLPPTNTNPPSCSLIPPIPTENQKPSPKKTTPYPISSVISYDKYTPLFQSYILAYNTETEPKTFAQTMKSEKWTKAADEELQAMELNKTWIVESLPPGKNVVGCKWVFIIKYNPDGSIERYKAKLVAQGFTQQEGIDFLDTFSPVAKLTSVKLMLGLAAAKGWTLTQMDVSNAFLHGELDEEIFMSLPQGYTPPSHIKLPPNPVCRLLKSLYGLKQASRQWYKIFSSVLLGANFIQSPADNTLFVKVISGSFIAVLVYVDDIMIASNDDVAVENLKTLLRSEFKIKDLGPARFLLGLEISRSSKGISVCQRKYAMNLLEDADMGTLLPNPTSYRELIGRLQYRTITRPDITYAVHQLSQFISAPSDIHLQAAHKVLRYIKTNPGQGLMYSVDSEICLNAFSDADWAACKDTRRSITGFFVYLGTSLISWKSKKQAVTSRSSTESEYRSMAQATCEIIWLQQLLKDLHVQVTCPAKLFCDNKSALHISMNPVFHERTKHIEIDCHTVRDQIKSGNLKALHVPTENQHADILTKALHPGPFHHLLRQMSLSSLFLPNQTLRS
ncbi:Reverse transcriptase RNA-dependent DNA polymerase [Arabidopsis suecica]|uniref:Reverse transcriptase RNA-dependent DNA polymerase n=1 Tax=Arabidopsis suecica TaxID=45249 RepID=A0A8T2CIK1_ARASU|nr:Reverse transcriptase RNA-dependent DNA polymerase [Arabidopsis suecica]